MSDTRLRLRRTADPKVLAFTAEAAGHFSAHTLEATSGGVPPATAGEEAFDTASDNAATPRAISESTPLITSRTLRRSECRSESWELVATALGTRERSTVTPLAASEAADWARRIPSWFNTTPLRMSDKRDANASATALAMSEMSEAVTVPAAPAVMA